MKQLTDEQILEAFDRALAEAARIAARRREAQRDNRHKGVSEDKATFKSGEH